MTLAIAIPGAGRAWDIAYEPVTDDSREIQRTWAQKRNYLEGSASDWLPTIEAVLRGIRNDCRKDNWDGSGANPVTDRTISLTGEIAETLFTMLPRGMPAPDLIPESDGEICISWSVDTDRLFALSVGEHSKINFAGQFGKEGSIHGWQPIDAATCYSLEESLQEVARYIGRL